MCKSTFCFTNEKESQMKQLYTRWGKNLDVQHVLEEYPRPLLVRKNYTCLNGVWEYAFTKEFRRPDQYDGTIVVPFSPESLLSGVNRQLQPDEYLWYRREFETDVQMLQAGGRLLLHFGAVDQSCRVYINGREAMRHTGGYLPFEGDITEYLNAEDAAPNELVVVVKDLSDTSYHARGKQKLKPGGMFYTAQSGIWQTVWMEYVPAEYVREIVTEPSLDEGMVRITVSAEAVEKDTPVEIRIREPGIYSELPQQEKADGRKTTAEENISPFEMESLTGQEQERTESDFIITSTGVVNETVKISLPVIRPWTCEEPWLYYFTVTMGNDQVESYFALRTFTVEPDEEGLPRICLNHKAQFQKGVLDQGYWSDGLYTAPSDEALIFDIRSMKDMGFNMIRKHIKIEPQRWYYHCDRLGMVVWQDMVNGGAQYQHWFVTYAATLMSWRGWKFHDRWTWLLSRTDKKGRLEFVREMKETIHVLKGHPSIAVWVIFNEGWGQFQTAEMTRIVRKLDPTRLIDQASGWFDQGGGDFQSFHNYFFKLKVLTESKRAAVLSEFGGYSLREEEHCVCEKQYGYGTYENREKLNEAYRRMETIVESKIPEGLCASVYTQLSDIEEESNGIFTYDREVQKIK
jgi:hypothetical protein